MAQLPRPSRSLPIALMRAREAVMGPIREMLSGEDLSEQQWRVLRVLGAAGGPLDGSTLAQRSVLLLPSLTRIVPVLEARELVTRSRGADRRRLQVEITAMGQAVIARNTAKAVEISDRWRAHLGAERYDTLLAILEDLAQSPAAPEQESVREGQ